MMGHSGRNRIALIAAALALGAAGPPALPGPQAISASDKASGAKAHPELLAEYGGAWAGPQAAAAPSPPAAPGARPAAARPRRPCAR